MTRASTPTKRRLLWRNALISGNPYSSERIALSRLNCASAQGKRRTKGGRRQEQSVEASPRANEARTPSLPGHLVLKHARLKRLRRSRSGDVFNQFQVGLAAVIRATHPTGNAQVRFFTARGTSPVSVHPPGDYSSAHGTRFRDTHPTFCLSQVVPGTFSFSFLIFFVLGCFSFVSLFFSAFSRVSAESTPNGNCQFVVYSSLRIT